MSAQLYIDAGYNTARISDGQRVEAIAIERGANGRLAPSTRGRIETAVRELARGRSKGVLAWCGLPARGVSLRQLTLPPAAPEALESLLALQIEKEFPLGPDALAWGWNSLSPEEGVEQRVLVAAVKREMVEEWESVLTGAGVQPRLTIGALALQRVCGNRTGRWSILHAEPGYSELLVIDGNEPELLRVLPGLDRGDPAEIEALAAALIKQSPGSAVVLAGAGTPLPDWAERLGATAGVPVEAWPSGNGGPSPVIAGIERAASTGGDVLPLLLVRRAESDADRATARPWRTWAAAAVALLLALGSLRYVEAVIKKPGLARRLAEIEAEEERLPVIDRELDFLQHLDRSQAAYLAALAALAEAAPRGMQLESISMNRRGDLSLRGTVQSPDQAIDFRNKLIKSGRFSPVVVEEQTPKQNRQMDIRLSAQWRTARDPIEDRKLEQEAQTAAKTPENGAIPKG